MQFDQLKRREFITLLGGAPVWPLVAHAQSEVPVIGFLSSLSSDYASHLVAAFRQGVTEAGFADGQRKL
jgi:putative ABC transport system substrate-binding protein